MKGIFATSSALVTLLLTISPTVASSAGGFQFLDQSTGNKFCKGCAECIVTCDYPGVQGSGVAIGNSYCSDMNGIVSVEAWGGLLTVDFSATIPGDTPVHWQEGNGTWIGGTAPTKDSSGIADVTDQGTSSQQWGSLGFNGGWCVANVVQYQKSDPSAAGTSQGGQYSYNISLFDNSSPRKWIGGTGKPLFVQDDDTLGIDSVLPSVFEITSGSKS